MKTIYLIFIVLISSLSISLAQTKKIALRSHSGANSNFTIYVPDEFGLGPIDYNSPKLPNNKKACPLKLKPIKANQIQIKDSIDSIKYCTPVPNSTIQHDLLPAPNSKPNKKKKKIKKVQQKTSKKPQKVSTQPITSQTKPAENTPLASFAPQQSSESILFLLLTIPAIFFFIFSIKKP